MATDGNEIKQKTSNKYCCEICDYVTDRKSNIENHYTTLKHLNSTNGNKNKQNKQMNQTLTQQYICEICQKIYKDRTGLWKHNKKCISEKEPSANVSLTENSPTNEIQELKEFMKYLMKENSDMKSMMMKVIENGTHNTTNTVTNSHNKAFNLNLFLNETCKDAMNINDFVESIKLQVSDLENVGEVGFVEGISNIIVKNLNALDITKRPIHCTDKKREIIYIKDENTWEKDESQCKMRRMIKKVVSKNQRLIPKFKEQNPEYNKSYSKVSDKYNKLIIESIGGSGDNDLEKENKIIRNISKNIVVDKSV